MGQLAADSFTLKDGQPATRNSILRISVAVGDEYVENYKKTFEANRHYGFVDVVVTDSESLMPPNTITIPFYSSEFSRGAAFNKALELCYDRKILSLYSHVMLCDCDVFFNNNTNWTLIEESCSEFIQLLGFTLAMNPIGPLEESQFHAPITPHSAVLAIRKRFGGVVVVSTRILKDLLEKVRRPFPEFTSWGSDDIFFLNLIGACYQGPDIMYNAWRQLNHPDQPSKRDKDSTERNEREAKALFAKLVRKIKGRECDTSR
jgi:hypothetical protein